MNALIAPAKADPANMLVLAPQQQKDSYNILTKENRIEMHSHFRLTKGIEKTKVADLDNITLWDLQTDTAQITYREEKRTENRWFCHEIPKSYPITEKSLTVDGISIAIDELASLNLDMDVAEIWIGGSPVQVNRRASSDI